MRTALALRRAGPRWRPPRRWTSAARSATTLSAAMEDDLQVGLRPGHRGHAGGRPVEHHRRPHLQLLRLPRRRLHRRRRLLVVAAGGVQRGLALAAGDLDLALAGGVDVSLDTFELIGFAKTGALTPDEMRVYDKRGNGFIPGEGCGFVVMKRLERRARGGRPRLRGAARLGHLLRRQGRACTAPSREGQATALRRAYAGPATTSHSLSFIEGHGTGTRVGDKVELEGLAAA